MEILSRAFKYHLSTPLAISSVEKCLSPPLISRVILLNGQLYKIVDYSSSLRKPPLFPSGFSLLRERGCSWEALIHQDQA